MLVHQLIFRGENNSLALSQKNVRINYGQLQKTTGRYRDYFYAAGIRPRDHVALFAVNSMEFVFSYMAIVSLGCVVVPLNTMLTPREISFILKDAGAKHIVTDKQLVLPAGNDVSPAVVQLYIPEINKALEQAAYPAAPEIPVGESDTCAILYTSGTTGRPKGAMLSHHNLISNAKSVTEALSAVREDNFLCVLPMFHSFAWTCAVLAPFYTGASVTVVELFSPKDVIATIRDQGVTVVLGVPAMYTYYAALAKPEELAGVRLFASGAASLPLETINSFFAKTRQRVIEGYGLSEASPACCFNPVDATKPGSIGLPLPGVKVRVVDQEGRETGPAQVGELIVQGPNVMSGYYGLSAETAEALRGGWLYTGDLAYKDEEGYVYIVDRKKDMVIVSGLNVYPREVEEVLFQYPAIKEAAVVGAPDKKRGESVRAYVVLKEGMKLDKNDLKAFLRANLAAYKLPRDIVELAFLPKNSTGKVLKNELRQLSKGK
ncbi:MAG: long-chain fatty acid--CoA ligase [Peptococcaceae bacterium]|nr:long-chain fatty acid--CoA ligase [Peptococcaceae bacterium]